MSEEREFEAFFSCFPEFRGVVDPARLLELLEERRASEEPAAQSTEGLSEEDRQILERVRARLFPERRPLRSLLATPRGWVELGASSLDRLAAAATVGFVASWLDVLRELPSFSAHLGGEGEASVETLDPSTGTTSPTRWTSRQTDPLRFASDEDGAVRLQGEVEFDLTDDEDPARFEGGAALACFAAPDPEEPELCVPARLERRGTKLVAHFDRALPGLTEPPLGWPRRPVRYRLVAKGWVAEALLRA